MSKPRIILLSIASVAVLVIGIGLAMYFKPHKNFVGADPDYTVTAAALIGEFSTDEQAATKKYVADDRVVLVRGVIGDVVIDDRGIAVVTVTGEGVDGNVSCTLTKEESARAQSLKAGDAVRITGQCTGMQGLIEPEVIMIRCGLAEE
ncbi:OB-fold putative lipoprotein [bacterium]|nr:OB-fold putative lipoprotein [bacterium]